MTRRSARWAARWALLALVGSAVAASLVSSAAGTTTPEAVTLTVTQGCISGPSPTFVASGAIADSGTVDYTFFGPAAGPWGLVGHTLKTQALFTGTAGTIVMRWNVMFKPTDDPYVFDEFGQWQIVGATGDYAGLTGAGRSSGYCDVRGGPDSEIQVLEGLVH